MLMAIDRHTRTFCLGTLLALATLWPTGAQSQPSDGPVLLRSPGFAKSPGPLRGLNAFKPASFDVEVQGSGGIQVTIKALPVMNFPGGKKLSDLFELADPLPPLAIGTPVGKTAPTAVAVSSGTQPQVVGTAVNPAIPTDLSLVRDDRLDPLVTIKKRLVYKGLDRATFSSPDTFFRAFDLEIQATRSGTDPVVRKTRFVLTDDNGPPAMVASSAAAATGPNTGLGHDFPGVVNDGGQAGKTYRLNFVKLHSSATLSVNEFTIPGANPPAAFRDVYKAVVVYDDGAKFDYGFENLGPSGLPGGLRLKVRVPNIGRGGYRVHLRTPFGTSAPSQHFDFPDNLFVSSLPVAQAPIVAANIDTPLSSQSEDNLWPPVHFDPAELSAQKRCGEPYGVWDSATLGTVEIIPVGVAGAKFTKTPTKGSMAHNGNMPRLSGSAAGLGTLKAHWTARIRMYVGECADQRLAD